jgi:hypothetical protein
MRSPDELEADVVALLAQIYAAINWRRVKVKSPWDVWNHRVRHCATRRTLGEFISRLANQFGLQHVPPEALQRLQELQPHEAEALDLIYREHIPIAMRAVLEARRLRDGTGPLRDDRKEEDP